MRIEWRTEQRKLSDLVEFEKNPRQLSQHDAEHIRKSIEKFGLADPLVVNADGQIIGGHQRKRIMLALEQYGADAVVDVRVPSRALDEREAEELNIRLNRNTGAFDFDILSNQFDMGDLLDWGFTDFDFEMRVVDAMDYSDLDGQLEGLEGYEEIDIRITVPAKHRDAVVDWLANGESKTAPGMGKGAMRRCGLL